MKKKTIRFNNFDFIRLVAASLVIYSHSYPLLGLKPPDLITRIFPFTNGGTLGVWTFFALSGYLNTASIRRNKSRVFLINRAIRIFPGLFVALLFCVLIVGSIATTLPEFKYIEQSSTWLYLYQNILLSPNYFLPGVFADNLYKTAVNGSLWTLPAEFTLYLCLPFFIKVLHLEKRGITVIAAILLVIVIASYSVSFDRISTFGLGSASAVAKEALMFFIGAVLSFDRLDKSVKKVAISTILVLVFSRTYYAEIAFLMIYPYLIINAGLIDIKLLRLRNDISYGVYIYAFPVQQLIYLLLSKKMNACFMTVTAMLVTYSLATISWFFVEKPILRNRQKILNTLIPNELELWQDPRAPIDRT